MRIFTYPLIIILSFMLVACEKERSIDQKNLFLKDDYWYEKSSNKKYSGKGYYYDDDTKYVYGSYENGLKIGEWTKIFVIGDEVFTVEILYKNGLKYNGLRKIFTDDKKHLIYEGNYIEGLKNGRHKLYSSVYSDKKLFMVTNYKDGIWNGYHETYHDGLLHSKTHYKNGIQDGWHYSYYKDGNEILARILNGLTSDYTNDFLRTCYKNGTEADKIYCEESLMEFSSRSLREEFSHDKE